MATRRLIDWESIEKEIRSNALSVRELARQYGVSDTAIRKHCRAKGIQRNLGQRYREEVREKRVRALVRKANLHVTDEEIIDAAAERGKAVLDNHEKIVSKGWDHYWTLSGQLRDAYSSRGEIEEAIKEDTTGPQGGIDFRRRNAMLRAVSLPVHIECLNKLAFTAKVLIGEDRRAYGIDEDGRRPDEPIDEIRVTVVRAEVQQDDS